MSFCLSICLLATWSKNYSPDLNENFTRDVTADKEELVNFGSDRFLDPDPGIFKRIFQHCKMGHPQVGSYLWKTNWILMKILS